MLFGVCAAALSQSEWLVRHVGKCWSAPACRDALHSLLRSPLMCLHVTKFADLRSASVRFLQIFDYTVDVEMLHRLKHRQPWQSFNGASSQSGIWSFGEVWSTGGSACIKRLLADVCVRTHSLQGELRTRLLCPKVRVWRRFMGWARASPMPGSRV